MLNPLQEYSRTDSAHVKAAIANMLRKQGLRVVQSFLDEFSLLAGVSLYANSFDFVFPFLGAENLDIGEFVDWSTSDGFRHALGFGGRLPFKGNVGPLLTFAYGGCGDSFAVDAARGTIWVELHDPDMPFQKIAGSFAEFLSRLRRLDPLIE